MIVDLDQERALLVLDWLEKVERDGGRPDDFWKAYAQTAKRLPPAIRSMGLAAALGLALQAARRDWDKDKAPGLMLATLADRLRGRAQLLGVAGIADIRTDPENPWDSLKALLAELIRLDRRDYRVLQAEALASLAWIKILAAAKAPEEEEKGETGDPETAGQEPGT